MRKIWWILSIILIVVSIGFSTVLHSLPKVIELIVVSVAMIFVALYINKKGSNRFLKIAASVLACYLLAVVVADIPAAFLVPKYLYGRDQVVISLLVKAIPSFFTFLGNLILFILCITKKNPKSVPTRRNIDMKKLCAVLIALSAFVCLLAGCTDKATDAADFKYTVNDEYVNILGYTGEDKEIIIPEEIDGKPVKCIGFNAFFELRYRVSYHSEHSCNDRGNGIC